MVRVTIELEFQCGLTERAIEEMYANQFGDDVVNVTAEK